MDKLFFINPIWDHKVFNWWNKFFDKFFDYKVLCDCEILWLDDRKDLYLPIWEKKRINLKTNFVHTYKHKQKFNKKDILLIWDIFTNTLCYTIKKWKRLYYSEFFLDEKPFIIKLIFYVIWFIFFHNKKFLLPHELWYKTFNKISNKCFYLPILYDGDICYSEKNTYETINLLFVWKIDNSVKNINFLIDNYLILKEKYHNINLTLVWKIFDADFNDRYGEYIKKWIIKHINFVKNSKELGKIYANNDIFILPSPRESIWAVIQESMAHWCAVIASNACWWCCFIEEWKNGYIFKVNDSEDFRNKIEVLLADLENLKAFKKKSTELIREKYDVSNDKLMKQYFYELNKFIFS